LRISAALARHFDRARKAPKQTKKSKRRTVINSKRVPTEQQMTKNNAAQSSDNARRDAPNLDSRYGQIGISAVAAALPYQSEGKNPAYAPAVQNAEKWIADKAA